MWNRVCAQRGCFSASSRLTSSLARCLQAVLAAWSHAGGGRSAGTGAGTGAVAVLARDEAGRSTDGGRGCSEDEGEAAAAPRQGGGRRVGRDFEVCQGDGGGGSKGGRGGGCSAAGRNQGSRGGGGCRHQGEGESGGSRDENGSGRRKLERSRSSQLRHREPRVRNWHRAPALELQHRGLRRARRATRDRWRPFRGLDPRAGSNARARDRPPQRPVHGRFYAKHVGDVPDHRLALRHPPARHAHRLPGDRPVPARGQLRGLGRGAGAGARTRAADVRGVLPRQARPAGACRGPGGLRRAD